MKELQLGFMHKRELAEWFGRSPQYFVKDGKAFKRYCEKLEYYADFEIVRGGVDIKKIYSSQCLSNLDINLKEEVLKVVLKAPESKMIKGGRISTAPAIAQEVLKKMPQEQRDYFTSERNIKSFEKMVQRTINKLYGSKPMERYWVFYKEGDRIMNDSDGSEGCKVSVPLVKQKGELDIHNLRELIKEEEAELEMLIREEEENDEEHSSFQAYQIMKDVADGFYTGNEKELRQEIARQSKPFYRAMKRFNAKYGVIYINRGTLFIERS